MAQGQQGAGAPGGQKVRAAFRVRGPAFPPGQKLEDATLVRWRGRPGFEHGVQLVPERRQAGRRVLVEADHRVPRGDGDRTIPGVFSDPGADLEFAVRQPDPIPMADPVPPDVLGGPGRREADRFGFGQGVEVGEDGPRHGEFLGVTFFASRKDRPSASESSRLHPLGTTTVA